MEEMFEKRIKDLANQSYHKGLYMFSNFLNEAEIADVFSMDKELRFMEYSFFGGYEGSVRQVLCFGSEAQFGYEEEFPIDCIMVEPVSKKFSEELSHRDYLGALMNLGIERNTIGDIIIRDKSAYIFCLKKVSDYILESFSQVRHTTVKVKKVELPNLQFEVKIEPVEVLVSSMRLDGILSKLLNISRSESILLFTQKKVFVNGRLYENNSGTLKEHDVVSVRGYGKFVYEGLLSETKKGKLRIKLGKYL
ncbi:MAG: hypothetical protein IJX86_11265 [Lachnospiraceae bacterium]|nr:hypothetical protein [Lachnospiraceae bacterium]